MYICILYWYTCVYPYITNQLPSMFMHLSFLIWKENDHVSNINSWRCVEWGHAWEGVILATIKLPQALHYYPKVASFHTNIFGKKKAFTKIPLVWCNEKSIHKYVMYVVCFTIVFGRSIVRVQFRYCRLYMYVVQAASAVHVVESTILEGTKELHVHPFKS